MTTKDVVSDFVTKVGDKENCTLDELKKLLTEVYKNKTKKKSSGVKKEPSAYNIFVKEEIARIKKEDPNVDNKQFMSIAAERWKAHKEKNNL
jgi:hypothetical protein